MEPNPVVSLKVCDNRLSGAYYSIAYKRENEGQKYIDLEP